MSTLTHRLARVVLHCYPFANGQGRLIDRTFLGRLRSGRDQAEVRCRGGFTMRVAPDDLIGRHLYLTGRFDRTIVDVLRHHCRPGARVLDVGANVGYVSCALLHAVPGCRVASVEPQPGVYRMLAANVAGVGGSRAVALNVAVSDRAGVARMAVRAGNSGASHLLADDAIAADTVQVRTVTGTELLALAGLDGVDVVKVDVEGHEVAVMQSLEPVLRRHRPAAVVFEHGGDLCDAGSPLRAVFDRLGYDVLGIRKSLLGWSAEPIAALATAGRRAHDYVAVPRPPATDRPARGKANGRFAGLTRPAAVPSPRPAARWIGRSTAGRRRSK